MPDAASTSVDSHGTDPVRGRHVSRRLSVSATLRMIALPYGFTLTVSCVLAGAIGSRGYPGVVPIWLFASGGCAGFCLLAILARAGSEGAWLGTPVTGNAVYNIAPVVVVPAVTACTNWVAADWLRLLVAGVLAVIFYVCGFSAFAALLRTATQRGWKHSSRRA
jgi:hypothetical protein